MLAHDHVGGACSQAALAGAQPCAAGRGGASGGHASVDDAGADVEAARLRATLRMHACMNKIRYKQQCGARASESRERSRSERERERERERKRGREGEGERSSKRVKESKGERERESYRQHMNVSNGM